MSDTAGSSGEFRRGWPVVVAAAFGSGLGISGLLTYTAGIFARELNQAIGLTRTQLGAAFFLATVALAAALPIVGRLVDRFGPRLPAAFGALALAVVFAAIGSTTQSVGHYIALMTVCGFVAAGSSPVGYTRAVSGMFDRHRGLALGLTQLGIGVAAAIVPPVLSGIIVDHGWRTGYLVLAVIALAGVVPALCLPRRNTGALLTTADTPIDPLRDRTFVMMLVAFGLMALAFAGMLPHFVPMLRETGVAARSAGAIAGLIGISVIVSRVVVGWLADHIDTARIAAASCAICGVGCLVLASGVPGAAWIGAVTLGAAMGAEADLIGYMTARYFGLDGYGRRYAIQYASFIIAAGVSPLWIGALADATGGYRLPLLFVAVGLIIAIVMFLRLPSTQKVAL